MLVRVVNIPVLGVVAPIVVLLIVPPVTVMLPVPKLVILAVLIVALFNSIPYACRLA